MFGDDRAESVWSEELHSLGIQELYDLSLSNEKIRAFERD